MSNHSDKTLRKAVIRLAHENPELRDHLLPLVNKKAGEPSVLLDRKVKAALYKFTQSMYDAVARTGGDTDAQGIPDHDLDAFAMEAEVQIKAAFQYLVRNWKSTAG